MAGPDEQEHSLTYSTLADTGNISISPIQTVFFETLGV